MATWLRKGIRFLAIIVGYAAACLASGVSLIVAAVWLSSNGPVTSWPLLGGAIIAYSIFSVGFVFMLTLFPAVAAIAYAEHNRVRSIFAFAGGGAVAGAMVSSLFFGARMQPSGFVPSRIMTPWLGDVSLFALCGLIGGAVYWLVAGRRSGSGCD